MTLHEIIAQARVDACKEALSRNGNNITRAARDLGIYRTHLMKIIKKHDLRTWPMKRGNWGDLRDA